MADLKEKGVILLATGNLPLDGVTAVTLYTVPVGKTCILDKLQVVASANNGAGSVARLAPVPNATTVEHFEYAAAVVIQANVTTANGSATNTYYLYGTLDDA
jgi:hypothetical protein